jgi:hypothetical protein
MKYAAPRPYADPEKAARRILEIANSVEPIQGRIHIEKINEPFLFRDRGSPAEYGAGLKQTSATLLFAAPAIATFDLGRHNVAAEHPFMNLTTCFRVLLIQGDKQDQQGTTEMRNLILGAASALALASPAVASDLPVTSYSESYARSYEYRTSPPVVVEESAPVVAETLVVRRPVIVAPPRVVVEDYPVYATPRVYAAPRVYAYEGPGWRGGWGHRRHFYGGW